MLKLISKLAWSNLVNNRRLYYPFALASSLSIAILYIFVSLCFNPDLKNVQGSSGVQTVLFLGIFVVTLAVTAIVSYANGFVMKNRTKEMGLYEILGLNKKHLIHMMGLELFIFASLSIGVSLILGLALDQLIYAFLLKLMAWPVSLVSTFQWSNLWLTLIISLVIFFLAWFRNLIRLTRLKALELNRESRKGEKKSRFLILQTVLGLGLLLGGYWLAVTVKQPIAALVLFFGATLMVIAGTYLVFNAGITVFLQMLKKRQSYYYQPKNFISLSNLIFRMKKNAMGLATIAILSTMVLITLIGGTNIYVGSENFIRISSPNDFAITFSKKAGDTFDPQTVKAQLADFARQQKLSITKEFFYTYAQGALENAESNQLKPYGKQSKGMPNSYLVMVDTASYQELTGKTVDLRQGETLVYANDYQLDSSKPLEIAGLSLSVKDVLKENFIEGALPNSLGGVNDRQIYLVVNNIEESLAAMSELPQDNDSQTTSLQPYVYVGFDTSASEKAQQRASDPFINFMGDTYGSMHSIAVPNVRVTNAQEIHGMMGSLFFIGIFLAFIFMLGTVLVIYYKQISEGYEDRDNFIILQKVGLDEQQTRQTIRKQVLTVFFLPLVFAFLHLAASFNMLRLILMVIVPMSLGKILMVTLAICLIFILVYLLVFSLTSRSYRKIVAK